MNLNDVISRFDEEIYKNILGDEIIETLTLLDSSSLYADKLRQILHNTYDNSELLSNKISRNHIIDSLRVEEVEELAKKLNMTASKNLWEEAKKLKFKGLVLEALFSFFDEEIPKKEEYYLEECVIVQPSYPMYPYQVDVSRSISKILASEKNRVLLHMPTGSGKTRTAINYICQHLRGNTGSNVIWFANTQELLEQAHSEFVKAWRNVGNRKVSAIKFWSSSKIDLSEISDSFIVAGIDKAYSALLKDVGKMTKFAHSCSLVIMDEAHQAIAPTYKLLLEAILIQNKTSIIGLSATPGRTWNNPHEDQKLADFFYKQKAIIRIKGFDNPVDYLVDRGYLARTVNTKLLYSGGISVTQEDIDYLKEKYVLSDKVLKQISEDKIRNIRIVNKIEELVKKHKRIILFGITKNHAIVLNSLLTALGINSAAITSETPSALRASIINEFKTPRVIEPKSMVLCNYGILTTGFDAPETSCAVISRPTDSLVLYSQMVGRAIRGTNAGGNTEAEIVTVVDKSLPGFGNVSDAFMNWEDVWENIN
ncbi:DEAD/DEAH box helicase [Maribellus sediminis]|uniref:DEAD/DEAH box helicase n=1 Tax=Maribellus sediminis TaxID=2696285 RepID=UPI00143219FC|nr:DEAD/DEAH box helicase [Maribellus sediminis]